MNKSWNVTLYRDGKAVSERHGVSERDALTQIYFLSRTGVPLEAVEEIHLAEPKTGELIAA